MGSYRGGRRPLVKELTGAQVIEDWPEDVPAVPEDQAQAARSTRLTDHNRWRFGGRSAITTLVAHLNRGSQLAGWHNHAGP